MFNHTKKINSENPESAPLDFYSNYIRTLKSDLVKEGSSSPITNKNPLPQKKSHPSTNASSFMQSTSPFFNENPTEQKTGSPAEINEKNLPPLPLNIKNDQTQEIFTAKKTFNLGKFILILLVFFIISLIIFGLYYFWTLNRMDDSSTTTPSTEQNTKSSSAENPITITSVSEKYSSINPNYLSIDINEASQQEISDEIKNVFFELKETTTATPIEFIITDKNNTPIAFPIFAIASKILLPTEVINLTDEQFSLYAYNDNGEIRTGLSIELPD